MELPHDLILTWNGWSIRLPDLFKNGWRFEEKRIFRKSWSGKPLAFKATRFLMRNKQLGSLGRFTLDLEDSGALRDISLPKAIELDFLIHTKLYRTVPLRVQEEAELKFLEDYTIDELLTAVLRKQEMYFASKKAAGKETMKQLDWKDELKCLAS